MPVCRYWQQGKCKHGNRCWNQHVGPGGAIEADAPSSNRFGALEGAAGSSGPPGHNQGRNNNDLPYGLNKDIIISDLAKERPQWLLSAYAPTRDVPIQLMGGYPREQSFEEMRLLSYQALATGNPTHVQQVIQESQNLIRQAEEEIIKIVRDIDGAIRYIIAGADSHPNRLDKCKDPNSLIGQVQAQPSAAPVQPTNPFAQPPHPSVPPAFGQPSAVGGTSAFGQPSQLATSQSAFGQPSQIGGSTSAFGRPSQLGAIPAFGQPSQPGIGGSSFGQPSQLGGGTSFGQPSQVGGISAFGQHSQLSSTSAFGQPSQVGGGTAFGKASQIGAGPSAFAQQPQPTGPSAFGQPSAQPQATGGFNSKPSQANPNPFAGVPTGPAAGAYGRPLQQQVNSPFATAGQSETTGNWQKDETGNPVPFPITILNPYQEGSQYTHPDLRTYSTRDPSNRLLTWKSKPVIYVDGQPCIKRDNDKEVERIIFPNGPLPYNRDTEMPENTYDEKTKEAYLFMRENGHFKDDWIPILPPRREWCKWDF